MFEKSSRFISGTMVEYAPSLIVDTSGRSSATKLIIGQRMPPHVFIRAADARPFELQDLLLSDTRFKILVFGGDITVPADREALQATADKMGREGGLLRRYGRAAEGTPGSWTVFDVMAFSSAKLDAVVDVKTKPKKDGKKQPSPVSGLTFPFADTSSEVHVHCQQLGVRTSYVHFWPTSIQHYNPSILHDVAGFDGSWVEKTEVGSAGWPRKLLPHRSEI